MVGKLVLAVIIWFKLETRYEAEAETELNEAPYFFFLKAKPVVKGPTSPIQ